MKFLLELAQWIEVFDLHFQIDCLDRMLRIHQFFIQTYHYCASVKFSSHQRTLYEYLHQFFLFFSI